MKKNGFTLVEIMIALVITLIAGSAVAVIFSMINKSKVNIAEKISATEFVSSLSKHLTSQVGCTASLVNQQLPTSTPAPISISFFKGYAAPASGTLAGGIFLTKGHLKLEALTIKDKGATPYDTIVNGITYRRIIAQLKVKMSVNLDKDSFPLERVIEFPVLTKISPASGLVDVCGIDASTSEVCTAMGGAFTPPNICTPLSVCRFMGTSYGCWPATGCPGVSYPTAHLFGMPSAAAKTAPPPGACANGGIPTSTGESSYTYVAGPCGKSGCTTYSNKAYFYICLQCN